MIVSDIGIVLGAIHYKHNSRILKVYTQKNGIVAFFVGIQKKSNILAFCQPLYPVNITYSSNSKSVSLYQIKEISTLFPLQSVYSHIKKTSVVFFISEVILLTIKEEASNEKLFSFLYRSIQKLENEDFNDGFVVEFLAEFTIYLGIEPLIENGLYFNIQSGELQNNFQEVLCLNQNHTALFCKLFSELSTQSFQKSEKQNLLHFLLHYYQMQIPNFKTPKSLEIIREVFS
ncbi:MAG: recombination protein [Bacteroidota bacterium]|jgi:DNA repair protein RecO (recombination protein O)